MSRLWQRLIAVWLQVPLRLKGIVLTAIPLLAIVISSTFAYLGNRERARAETDVARHFDVVIDLEEILTSVVNAETGIRGYLLTRHVEFLRPYQFALQLLPARLADLRAEVQQEPGLKPRLEKGLRVVQITALIKAVMKSLQALQSSAKTPNKPDLYHQLATGRQRMDDLRTQLRLMRVEEKRLLTERLAEIMWVRQRDYWVIGLTLLVSLAGRFLALHLFNTGIVKRVQQVQENVRCLGQGQSLPFASSTQADALGELEREVETAHRAVRPRPLSGD